MKKLFLIVVGMLVMGAFANNALAANGTGGYIEVCKAANPALTGTFSFNIHDSVGDLTSVIGLGTCTTPLPVAPGPVTVTEQGSLTGLTNTGTVSSTPTTAFVSATTTAVGPSGTLAPGTGFVYTATVPPSTNGSNGVVTITYTDTLVTGVVEVCKTALTGSGLTGSWSFTITGGNGFSQVVSVPVGSCSAPIPVPAGLVKVVETGDLSEAVTSITATQTAANTNAVVGPNAGAAVTVPGTSDLPTATVVVSVVAGDASKQTLVTYTNNSVRLKLCKYVDAGLTNTTAPGNSQFPFTLTYSGNSGPNTGPASTTLAAGNTAATAVCTVIGTFRAGTTVTLTEGIIAGTKVGSITTNPTTNTGGTATVVPGSLSLPNRTVAVVLGVGETVVTYEDVPALPGTLKICKVAGASTPPVAPGTVFTFTVTPTAPVGTPVTVSVPAGSCAVVGNYAFDTTASIVETAVAHVTVQSITAIPGLVSVLEGGVATNTIQPVLTNVNLLGGSASVTIGENNTTEVTYVNIDPPNTPATGGTTGGSTSSGSTSTGSTPVVTAPVVTAPVVAATSGGSTVSSTSGGGSSSSGSSSGSSSTAAATPTLSIVPTNVGAALQVSNSTSASNTTAATKAAVLKAVKLQKLHQQVATLKMTLKTLVAKHAAAKTLIQKHALAKHIAALKVSEAKLFMQIKLLK